MCHTHLKRGIRTERATNLEKCAEGGLLASLSLKKKKHTDANELDWQKKDSRRCRYRRSVLGRRPPPGDDAAPGALHPRLADAVAAGRRRRQRQLALGAPLRQRLRVVHHDRLFLLMTRSNSRPLWSIGWTAHRGHCLQSRSRSSSGFNHSIRLFLGNWQSCSSCYRACVWVCVCVDLCDCFQRLEIRVINPAEVGVNKARRQLDRTKGLIPDQIPLTSPLPSQKKNTTTPR